MHQKQLDDNFSDIFDFFGKKKCAQKCANTPQKYANIRKSAQIRISALLHFGILSKFAFDGLPIEGFGQIAKKILL